MAVTTIRRRMLPLLALAAVGRPALADTTDLVVTCDTTLGPALNMVAAAYEARSGVRVFVFPTGPGLILPQLIRDIQNDIVVTQATILQQAAEAGVIASPISTRWRNPLVIAGTQRAVGASVFAAPDPSPMSDIDGPALLARLAVTSNRIVGAVDTDEVAFLLINGVAQAGLLHMTDVRADKRLAVLASVPAELQPPLHYGASVTRLARRPNPGNFIVFLNSGEAADILVAAGLEPIA